MLEADADDDCVGRDRLDAHVLPGQDVDRRPRRAAQAAAAPAHPGQPRAAVGQHRHGLHEPEPGRARRPGVRARPDPARRRRARPCSGTCPTPRSPRASATGPAPRWPRPRLRSLRLARFGDNMRDVAVTEGDKVEAELTFGVSVNGYGVNDAGRGGRRRRRTTRWTRSSPNTQTSTTSPPSCCPAASGTTRCATGPASRRACGSSSPRAASRPSPRTSRTSARCASSRVWPCSA